jgi:hypothetical protein
VSTPRNGARLGWVLREFIHFFLNAEIAEVAEE